jgi:hypothetical protein
VTASLLLIPPSAPPPASPRACILRPTGGPILEFESLHDQKLHAMTPSLRCQLEPTESRRPKTWRSMRLGLELPVDRADRASLHSGLPCEVDGGHGR